MKKKLARVKRDYKNASKPNLLSRANNVYTSMNGNTLFPNPPVKMKDHKQEMDNLELGMASAQHGDRLKSSQKNATGEKVIENLDKLANYVEVIANGDAAIIMAAGFAVSDGSISTKTTISPIENFTVINGPNSGEVTISLTRVQEAISYSFYYGIDDGEKTIWFDVPSSLISVVISNLEPGKTYAFRATALGTRNKRSYSEIIKKVVF